MGVIGRYIFRTTLGAFLLLLVSITTLMWITQSLRDIDLVTNQGQSVWVFVALTALIIPLLVMIIAPVAFMVAMAYVLNKLSTDSELIVMNAAGLPPWQIFRPFLAVGLIVSLLVGAMAAYVSPKSLRELATWFTEIRADLVTRIVQPGFFTPLAGGSLILHIREREPDGQLRGIFIDDQRDAKERVTFVAEEGTVLKNSHGTFLVLANGNVQRYQATDRDPNIVQFDRYAFDLSQLMPETGAQKFSARERYLWELFDPKADDPTLNDQPEQMRAELHDRITAPLFPLAIAVLTFAYLGVPRTTRQGRTASLLSAIGAVVLLRGLGFVGTLAGTHTAAALLLPYAALMTTFAFGCWGISRGASLELPVALVDAIAGFVIRMSRAWQL
jgi:lipopolysaccharide export system permease protein